MKPIRAIYENGVFKPTEPVDLPEHARVTVEAEADAPETKAADARLPDDPLPEALKAHPQYEVYKLLSRRYRTGIKDLAERHEEHQP